MPIIGKCNANDSSINLGVILILVLIYPFNILLKNVKEIVFIIVIFKVYKFLW